MLNEVFTDAKEAKIAEGLFRTLVDAEQPVIALRLKREAHPDIRAFGIELVSQDDYERVIECLAKCGYVKIGGMNSAEAMSLGPTSLVTITPEAKMFFQERYSREIYGVNKNDNRR